ncbi:hypothetical protein GUITHDRAFT_144251 [Guillardia theta CCMP2712]|uniref:PDZ domain-containing protein n=1 Tax=Guillardia theta (strain CCMP2712) TaxID=905079 RepID=L1IQX4_GUITC|nr:hypothetical protein GUITHDRAFT_144251 [Guillardia theta CCMP2712]EKX38487.1 hypothetical protein GUITHDRAFT_144251 [Guillardia theta CCMP2712]|eukprot:XP_005825467.1 hypothetical protein GUITHDRAFT_144251 [Guillardia theta CCMP2712]
MRMQMYPPPMADSPVHHATIASLPPTNGSARPMSMPMPAGSPYVGNERRNNMPVPPGNFTGRPEHRSYMMVNSTNKELLTAPSHNPRLPPRHPSSSSVPPFAAPERGMVANSLTNLPGSRNGEWPQTPREEAVQAYQLGGKANSVSDELASLNLDIPDDQWYEPGIEGLPAANNSALSPRSVSSSQQERGPGLSAAARKAQQKAYNELARLAMTINDEESPMICGVGISFLQENGRIFIRSIQEGSPAAETGILDVGDQLCLIDHTSIDGLSVIAAEDKLYGEENSVVILSVLKQGEDRLTHATLVRSSGQKERNEKKRKEIYDVGISFSVSPSRQVVITELAAGGPADKLGFISVGDVILAIDEEPLPQGEQVDVTAFVNARICGPKGSPVVLTLVKPGLGMKQHVQLRRNHLFGATDVRSKSDKSDVGSNLMSVGALHFLPSDASALKSQMNGLTEDAYEIHKLHHDEMIINPVYAWKNASWRPKYEDHLIESLRDIIASCLSVGQFLPSPRALAVVTSLASGVGSKYSLRYDGRPLPAGRALGTRGDVQAAGTENLQVQSLLPDGPAANTGLIQVGDIVAEIGGSSVRGLPFDRVTSILTSS